mmetsp:Transcript_5454/g.23065  ORF Transcript_5454/g.23065 Transcript_5454/m.23065 type:complete len:356 (+) Transcript_5454:150-1217(+)
MPPQAVGGPHGGAVLLHQPAQLHGPRHRVRRVPAAEQVHHGHSARRERRQCRRLPGLPDLGLYRLLRAQQRGLWAPCAPLPPVQADGGGAVRVVHCRGHVRRLAQLLGSSFRPRPQRRRRGFVPVRGAPLHRRQRGQEAAVHVAGVLLRDDPLRDGHRLRLVRHHRRQPGLAVVLRPGGPADDPRGARHLLSALPPAQGGGRRGGARARGRGRAHSAAHRQARDRGGRDAHAGAGVLPGADLSHLPGLQLRLRGLHLRRGRLRRLRAAVPPRPRPHREGVHRLPRLRRRHRRHGLHRHGPGGPVAGPHAGRGRRPAAGPPGHLRGRRHARVRNVRGGGHAAQQGRVRRRAGLHGD